MQKFVRYRARKYGLSSQRKMLQSKCYDLLKENGFVITDRNKNCLFLHNSNESMKHFIVKSIIFKILRGRGRNVGTEIETRDGIADVIDLDNLIVYEVENSSSKDKIKEKLEQFKNFKDLFIIDPRKLPDGIEDLESALERLVV